jgi:hypothetical protein
VRIKLTAQQVEALRPYFDRVSAAAAMGSPGMLVGHLGYSTQSGYGINVGFLDHDKAQLIVEAARWEIPGALGDRKTVPQNRAGRPPDIAKEAEGQAVGEAAK